MNNIFKASVLVSSLILVSCANQNKIAQQQLEPVSNACQKLDYLIKAYDDGFSDLKQTKIKAGISNIWQAKYHLIGKNCRIWSWGKEQTTYSCNTIKVDESDARKYYSNAKATIAQCLGTSWQLNESARRNDDGIKAEYTNTETQVTLSTHLVPDSGLFKSKWSVYYYVGRVE